MSFFYTAGWSSPVAREAHNLEVVGSNPAPATSLDVQTRLRPGSKEKVGMVFMPAFFRFYAVFRGLREFCFALPHSSFLRGVHYLGYVIGADFGVLGPFSLFLRFSAVSG